MASAAEMVLRGPVDNGFRKIRGKRAAVARPAHCLMHSTLGLLAVRKCNTEEFLPPKQIKFVILNVVLHRGA